MKLTAKLNKFLDYFQRDRKSAALAKERLQIIIAHERSEKNKPDYLPLLQKDLLAVISKYIPIDPHDINIELDQKDEFSVLELNIVLPHMEEKA